MLSILRLGTPGWLYMIQDSKYWRPVAGEDEKSPTELSPGSKSDRFTFAAVMSKQTKTQVTRRAIRYYRDIKFSESPVIELRVLSKSDLEIVQTGVKNEWTKKAPPLGLYPGGPAEADA